MPAVKTRRACIVGVEPQCKLFVAGDGVIRRFAPHRREMACGRLFPDVGNAAAPGSGEQPSLRRAIAADTNDLSLTRVI